MIATVFTFVILLLAGENGNPTGLTIDERQ